MARFNCQQYFKKGVGVKIFNLGDYEYQAKDCVDGILIDPLVPPNFWTQPIEERKPEELEQWAWLQFIVSDPNGIFRVYCLNYGAHDRPSLMNAGNLSEMLVYLKMYHYVKH